MALTSARKNSAGERFASLCSCICLYVCVCVCVRERELQCTMVCEVTRSGLVFESARA